MAGNVYDDPEFFDAYSAMPRSVEGLDGAAEWSSLRALLPPVDGARIVDLGCGFGWFARWARAHGAATVLAIDGSERMLARAVADTDDDAIVYERADLDSVELPMDAFDLAFSSLAFHYLLDLPRLFTAVHDALRPGGDFVFSVEHPLTTAPEHQEWVEASGRRSWAVNSYLDEGPRTTDWLVRGVVKQHRTFGTYVNTLVASGFTVTHVEDWGPTDEQLAADWEWADERDRPTFMLLAAHR